MLVRLRAPGRWAAFKALICAGLPSEGASPQQGHTPAIQRGEMLLPTRA